MKKSPRPLVALAFALLPVFALAQSADALLAEGAAAFQKKDYDTALAKFSAALPLAPSRSADIKNAIAECYLERGASVYNRGDYAAAIADYTKGLEYSPSEDLLYYNRGLAKYVLEDYSGALADYDQTIKLEPGKPYGYESRGQALFARGEYTKAIVDFSKAIEIDPSQYSLWSNRGESKYLLRDYPGALADLDKAVELKPDSPSAHLVRARIKAKKGDKEGALADYDAAIALKPAYAAALEERAKLRHERKEYEGEGADYLALFTAKPEERQKLAASARDAFVAAGDARNGKGEYREAAAQYGSALELAPGSAIILEKRASARAAMGDHGGSIEDYAAAIAANHPSGKRLSPLLSAQYEERGADRSASGDYEGASLDFAQAASLREGGLSALHLAAARGDAKLIAAMLRSGTPPDAKDAEGATALMYAIDAGSLEAVKALVAGKADPKADGILWADRKQGQYYGSLLAVAAGSKAPLELLRYLVETCKLDVNAGSLIAGKSGRSDLVPAFWACYRGNYDKLEYLLRKGANPNATFEGSSLLALSLGGQNKDERFPLLLLDKKAVVDKTDASPLVVAADKGFVKVVKRLLDAGIPASARMADGSCALHFAARSGQAEAASLLIKRGADIDAALPNGATALHFASQAGHAEIVSLLISKKANLDAKAKIQKDGAITELTALDVAKAAGQAKVVDLLVKAGGH